MKSYFVYIMSNKSRRLYTGITSTLGQRVYQHKNKVLPGFTARYKFDMLVYFEEYSYVMDAIAREKEIKSWRREKKMRLILAENPDWADLSAEWEEDPSWRAISSEEMRPMACLTLNRSGADSAPSRRSSSCILRSWSGSE
jgi:putative endonuclease